MPEVTSTARRTGRAELDEHVQGVESAEIDVRLQMKERPREAVLEELRKKVSLLPGTNVTTTAVVRGAKERLVPILMTALAAGVALVPIALSAGEPGSEIQAPMAMVIMFARLRRVWRRSRCEI